MGHPSFRCWKRPNAKCSKCNQLGHKAIICRSKFQQHEANAQVVEQNEDHIFSATCFSTGSNSEYWLIDSGSTNHMTYIRQDLKPTNVSKVRIGNDGHISTERKGTIAISTSLGTKIISNVLYCPLNINTALSMIVGREFLKKEQATYNTQVSPTELWHKRLGHYHLERMFNMKKKDMSRGLPILSNNLPNCYACQFGKQNRKSFPKSAWRAYQKLQLIHTDVAGPQRTPSLQGRDVYFNEGQQWIGRTHKKQLSLFTTLEIIIMESKQQSYCRMN
ncbi:hypothetical protein CR513_06676, partial [Mucuna pruriens]